MAWLNQPIAIIEDYRITVETQWYFNIGEGYRRTRTVTWTRTRWVGSNYTGAKAKAAELSLVFGVVDTTVIPAGGGQYHVLCSENTDATAVWTAWTKS
jgi:hypothetical protein